MYRKYILLCRNQTKYILEGASLLVISGIITLKLPFLLNDTMDVLFDINRENVNVFVKLFLIYIVLFLVQNVIDYVSTMLFKRIGNENAKQVSAELADRIINSEKKVPEQITLKNIFVVLSQDVFNLGETGILLAYRFIYLIVNIIALLFYMFKTNYAMALIVALIFGGLILFQNKCNYGLKSVIENGRKVSGDFYYTTTVLVENHEEHFRNGADKYVISRFITNLEKVLNQKFNLKKKMCDMQLGNSVFIAGNMIAIFLLGSFFVIRGNITLSQLMTFNMFSNSFGGFLSQLPAIFAEKKEFDISCKRVIDAFKMPRYEKHEYNNESEMERLDDISLENVCFSYSENEVLSNFSLKLKRGNIYGITGGNGSGKSTLLGILNGDLDLKSGDIKINDYQADLHKYKLLFKNYISTYSSNPLVYNDSILNNIELDEKMRFEDINNVMKILNMQNWIESLEKKLGTEINELKENLSDGQKQKICLARFLLRTKQIIIMDEMEKHIDIDTKKNVMEYLNKVKNNHIVILVSHDEYIQKRCDKIIEIG